MSEFPLYLQQDLHKYEKKNTIIKIVNLRLRLQRADVLFMAADNTGNAHKSQIIKALFRDKSGNGL